jgi:hypothetical protein
LPAITLPSSSTRHDDDSDWYSLIRRLRLQAALEGPLDPVVTIEDGQREYDRPRVVVARHLASIR